jgi:hypothetical protein
LHYYVYTSDRSSRKKGNYLSGTVLHILEPKRLAIPPFLPAGLIIPPLPPCLLPVVTFLREQNITPVLMSSDASFEYAGGPPSSVFNNTELAVANCTACIMVADSFFPLSGPPAVAVIIHGIERIRHGNPFIGELVGGTGMSYLRSPFLSPLVSIEADMNSGEVTSLQDQQIHLPPDQVSAQHWVYGAVLRAFLQGRGDHPRVCHRHAHPERFHPATRNLPARPSIPRSQWSTRNWLNHLADRYASPDPMATASFKPGLRPRRVFYIQVEDLLNQVMSPDSLVWVSQDMPTVNPVCSILSPLLGRAYLAQRDSRTFTRSALTRYYPEGYWSQSSLGLLQSVLDNRQGCLTQRATYLNIVWDHAATRRRTGLFSGRPAEMCPPCGLPDSLDHVVIRCQVLSLRRQEIRRDTFRPYERGASPSSRIPSGCSARVRNYLRSFFEMAFNVEGSIADHDALAMWVARPQKSSVERLDGVSPPPVGL